MDKKDLLKEPVRDMHLSRNSTLKELMDQFSESGGFTSAKISTAFAILKKMFTEENTTFLSFPADIISTGTRGIINELVKRKMVDVIITTTGTLDHDVARTYGRYYSGTFDFSDRKLADLGINRLGNVFVPDESYGELIEEKIQAMLADLYEEKKEWSGTELLKRIGLRIEDESSILYNAARNNIYHGKKIVRLASEGKLSGAKLEEAISWRKIREDAEFVNLYGDITVILPILIGSLLD